MKLISVMVMQTIIVLSTGCVHRGNHIGHNQDESTRMGGGIQSHYRDRYNSIKSAPPPLPLPPHQSQLRSRSLSLPNPDDHPGGIIPPNDYAIKIYMHHLSRILMRNHQEQHILDGLPLPQCPQSTICFFANYFIILLTLCNFNNNNNHSMLSLWHILHSTGKAPKNYNHFYLDEGKCPIRTGNYNSIPPLFAIFIAIPSTQEYT